MDFFDPQKQKLHSIRLNIGYLIIGAVLLLTVIVLQHMVNGFWLDDKGNVIQNGLVFVSTHPEGADVYLNGERYKDRANTRLNTPAGQYVLELRRNGYRTWKRALTVEGGKLQRFIYPFLFPSELQTTVTRQYDAAPVFSTQSPDRRWLLVAAQPQDAFDLYDLNAKEPAAQPLAVPADVLAAGSSTTGWQLVEWSKDNRHVVLRRSYDRQGQPGTEYILLDREDPSRSQNLTVLMGFNPTVIELQDQVYDHYYLYDQGSSQLFTATLREPTPKPLLSGVLAFASQKDIVAYATAEGADDGKVAIRLKQDDGIPVTVRQVPADTAYVLDMAEYGDRLYLAAGAASEGRVFLFRDPLGALRKSPDTSPTPVQILKVAEPSHLSFSLNKRFVIAEHGNHFAVYDIETDRGYAYQIADAPDAPQTHATWMDGFRLSYVSGGKLVVFDYDGTNVQALSPASPSHLPAFNRDYRYLYTIDGQNALTVTPLLTPQDL